MDEIYGEYISISKNKYNLVTNDLVEFSSQEVSNIKKECSNIANFDIYFKDKMFTKLKFSKICNTFYVEIEKVKGNSIYSFLINKSDDDYFYIAISSGLYLLDTPLDNDYTYYQCDQIEGLLKLMRDKLPNKKL